jgi:hypothetical protein
MKNAILLVITALVALFQPTVAAVIWCMSVALMHAVEETKGKLWVYFGHTTNSAWLTKLSPLAGFLLIVAPALALQWFAASRAFSGAEVHGFWLALLLGARIGDGLFSHFIPFAHGHQAVGTDDKLAQRNPGLGTAAIYIVDSLLIGTIWRDALGADSTRLILGFGLGAGFFALVQPALRQFSEARRSLTWRPGSK